MKTKFRIFVLSALLLFTIKPSKAQILIHYWDFNTVRPLDGSGTDSVGTTFSYTNGAGVDSNSATWPLYTSYTQIPGAKIVYYRPQFHYGPAQDSILDCVGPGGSFIYDYSSSNYSYFHSSDSSYAEGNGFLKARNSSDSAEFYLYIPTTGYGGISMQFAISQSSTKGAIYNIFSYSTNGGTTWKNLTGAMDTFNIGGVFYPDTLQASNPITSASGWYPVQINFSSDHTVDNNPNFIVRFRLAGPNTTLPNGNDRYDNFAIWATTSGLGVNEVSAETGGYTIYPNPAADEISLVGTYAKEKLVSVYNIVGQQIFTTKLQANQSLINVSDLSSGIYFVNIKETDSGNSYTLKLVKN
jgi:hypothetical protein